MPKSDELVKKYKGPLGEVADKVISRFVMNSDRRGELVRESLKAIYRCDEEGKTNVREAVQDTMIYIVKRDLGNYDEELVEAFRRVPTGLKMRILKLVVMGFIKDPDSFRVVFGQLLAYSKIVDPQVYSRVEGELMGIGTEFGRLKRIDAGTRKPFKRK